MSPLDLIGVCCDMVMQNMTSQAIHHSTNVHGRSQSRIGGMSNRREDNMSVRVVTNGNVRMCGMATTPNHGSALRLTWCNVNDFTRDRIIWQRSRDSGP